MLKGLASDMNFKLLHTWCRIAHGSVKLKYRTRSLMWSKCHHSIMVWIRMMSIFSNQTCYDECSYATLLSLSLGPVYNRENTSSARPRAERQGKFQPLFI